MKALLIAMFFALVAPSSWAASTCGSPGSFVAAGASCCQGLVLDGANRCQYAACKKVNMAAVVNSDGTSDCCFGLAPVSGVCRAPTLQRVCAILGTNPTASVPCCVGLNKGPGGTCVRNTAAQCSANQIPACCNGPLISTNTCACYCPSPYYVGS